MKNFESPLSAQSNAWWHFSILIKIVCVCVY